MAMEVLLRKSLSLYVEEGMNEKGEPIIKCYTYSNVKGSATADELVEAASALADLYDGPVDYTTSTTNTLFV